MGEPGCHRRFGYRNYPEMVHGGIPQEFILALPFAGKVPHGTLEFHRAFLAEI